MKARRATSALVQLQQEEWMIYLDFDVFLSPSIHCGIAFQHTHGEFALFPRFLTLFLISRPGV